MIVERRGTVGADIEDTGDAGGREHLAQLRREPEQTQAGAGRTQRLAELAEHAQTGIAGIVEFGQIDDDVTLARG